MGISQQTYDLAINGYQDNGTSVSLGQFFSTEIGGDGMECIIDPTDDNYMYGALYYGDIRRSTNGGTTFGGVAGSITETGAWVTPYKLDPNDPNRMFAGYDNVWRSDNIKGGTPSWSRISNFSGTSNMVDIAIAPSNSNVVYASRSNTSQRFFVTTNALAANPSWTNLTSNLPVSSTPRDIEIDHTDPTHIFVAIGNDIYESTNSGSSWTNISGTLPNISLNTIVIDKDSPLEAMYVGMDAGVYYIDNNLSDWVMYSNGIPNVEITELEIHYSPTNCKSTLYAATYGQGLWKSDLKDPGGVAPIACFESIVTTACAGAPITLTDLSSYTPTSWTWTITPTSYTFTGGTNANSQNPQVQFNAAGTYTISLSASNGTGSDTETKNAYITVSNSSLAPNFNDDFESYANCGNANDCGTTVCNLSGSLWTNLTNGSQDNIDWRVDDNGTPSNNTGPSTDYNPGTTAGNYIFTEASNCFGQTAILESQCIDLDQPYDFSFAYHMSGGAMGELHLDIFTNGDWQNDVLPAVSGNQGANWLVSTVDLTAYAGSTVKLRFRGITGGGFESDIALDDLTFTPKAACNVSLSNTAVTCNGLSDGTVTSTPSGVSPYTFLWNTGQTTANLNNVVAGVYTVTMTDNASCTSTASTTVTEPSAINISSSTNPESLPGNDGDATIIATGGAGVFAYQWDANAGSLTTVTATGLTAGNYSFTVTDANGCTITSSASVADGCVPCFLTASANGSNLTCNGNNSGTATAIMSNGTAPYTYIWSPSSATTNPATNLNAGVHTVVVTDNAGCTATASVTLTEPAAIIPTSSSNPESCVGSDGDATVSATGGAGGFTYVWSQEDKQQILYQDY